MAKYLVTGSGGFVGQHLVNTLVDSGHEVFGVDNFSGCSPGPFKCTTQSSDITNLSQLDLAFRYFKPQYVIHAAAYAAECLSPFIRGFNYSNNVVGTANVVTCCINYNVFRLDFLSSVAVYGKSEERYDTGWNEDENCQTSDPYGNAKLACERDIKIAYEQHRLSYRIWRMHNVFGIYQNIWDPFRNVIGIFINKLLNNNPLPIFGNGMQIRQFTPVEYVVKGIVNPSIPEREIYNIGSDQEYAILDIARVLGGLVHSSLEQHKGYEFFEARHEAMHPKCDHTKIQKYIGKCDYDLAKELRKVIEWAKTARRFESNLPEIELRKGLPEAWL